jgi:hypothetical protein
MPQLSEQKAQRRRGSVTCSHLSFLHAYYRLEASGRGSGKLIINTTASCELSATLLQVISPRALEVLVAALTSSPLELRLAFTREREQLRWISKSA